MGSQVVWLRRGAWSTPADPRPGGGANRRVRIPLWGAWASGQSPEVGGALRCLEAEGLGVRAGVGSEKGMLGTEPSQEQVGSGGCRATGRG